MLTLPSELAEIVVSFLRNEKEALHKELRDLSYAFIRNHYLGMMRVLVTEDGNAPYWPNPVFAQLPTRFCWPPLNYYELREELQLKRQYGGIWI